jgi:hypothetical protein
MVDNYDDHDDQYLFRLVSTFCWDDANAFCNRLFTEVETAADACRRDDVDDIVVDECTTVAGKDRISYDWNQYDYDGTDNDILQQKRRRRRYQNRNTLQRWLNRVEAQLYYTDQWGNCALHAASYVKPPVDVITNLFHLGRILFLHNGRSGRKNYTPIWSMTSKDKSTPYLVACTTGASLPVLHAYLTEVEYYIEQQWCHTYYAKMIIIQPDEMGVTSLSGWTAFHDSYINLELVKMKKSTTAAAQQPSLLLLSEYWDFVCRALIFATTPSSRQLSSTFTLVHRCAAIADHCPVSLLSWVIACLPNDSDNDGNVRSTMFDDQGRLPLHCALEVEDAINLLSTMDHSAKTDNDMILTTTKMESYGSPMQQRNRFFIVQRLLEWYPQAAVIPYPSNGMSPIVYAIMHGAAWHCNDDDGDGLLQLLLRHSPEQLLEVDSISGLYPFMLAATVVPIDDDKDEHTVVENIYNLLRTDPELCCKSSNHVKYD